MELALLETSRIGGYWLTGMTGSLRCDRRADRLSPMNFISHLAATTDSLG